MAFLQKKMDGKGSFGPALQELRELRGLTRTEVARRTKIHESLIVSLEEERIEDWKDPIYAERHVLAILKILDAQPGYFLLKYRELLKNHEHQESDHRLLPTTIRRRDFFVASRFFAFAGFFLILLGAAFYLLWQAHALQRSPPLEIVSPVEGELLTSSILTVRGQTDPKASITINSRPVIVGPQGNFELTLDIPRGLSVLTVEARRRYGSPTIQTRRVTYDKGWSMDEIVLPTSTDHEMKAETEQK